MEEFIKNYWSVIVPIIVSIISIVVNYEINKVYNKALITFKFFTANGFMWLMLGVEGNSFTKDWELKVESYVFDRNEGKEKIALKTGELTEISGASFNPKESHLFCLGKVNWDIKGVKIYYEYKTNRLKRVKESRIISCETESLLNYTAENHEEITKAAFLGLVNYFTGSYYNTTNNLAMSKETTKSFMTDLKKVLNSIK